MNPFEKVIELTRGNGMPLTDKFSYHSYLKTYSREITKFENIDFLEIGIATFVSTVFWQKLFIDSKMYGLDTPEWAETRRNTKVMDSYGDWNNLKEILAFSQHAEEVKAAMPDMQFDYIVEDGDHSVTAQMPTFKNIYPHLKPGGKYFLEDVEGPESLRMIIDMLDENNIKYIVDDYSEESGLFDDIIITIYKD